jgi:hypothetical protein
VVRERFFEGQEGFDRSAWRCCGHDGGVRSFEIELVGGEEVIGDLGVGCIDEVGIVLLGVE